MTYPDQIYNFLLQSKPGTKFSVSSAKDPAKFVETVKDLMDNWGMRDKVEFNGDYTILRVRK
jgi:hypothetical protein